MSDFEKYGIVAKRHDDGVLHLATPPGGVTLSRGFAEEFFAWCTTQLALSDDVVPSPRRAPWPGEDVKESIKVGVADVEAGRITPRPDITAPTPKRRPGRPRKNPSQ